MELIEHYLSIQGEGLHPGKLTYFVRFARCNLACVWCDSAYTFGKGTEVPFEAVTRAIRQSGAGFVCLTGGEPLLHAQDCVRLIQALPDIHFDVETGGSLDIGQARWPNSSIIMDWKLKHSGMNHKMKEENLLLLRSSRDLLKFVTDMSEPEKEEILRIISGTGKMGFPISLQPVYGTDPQVLTEWMISLKNPRLQVNLQIHKVIWGPERIGV